MSAILSENADRSVDLLINHLSTVRIEDQAPKKNKKRIDIIEIEPQIKGRQKDDTDGNSKKDGKPRLPFLVKRIIVKKEAKELSTDKDDDITLDLCNYVDKLQIRSTKPKLRVCKNCDRHHDDKINKLLEKPRSKSEYENRERTEKLKPRSKSEAAQDEAQKTANAEPKPKKKEKFILLERGPTRRKDDYVFDTTTPYSRQQINRRSFSGGGIIEAKITAPPSEDEILKPLIPITVNSYIYNGLESEVSQGLAEFEAIYSQYTIAPNSSPHEPSLSPQQESTLDELFSILYPTVGEDPDNNATVEQPLLPITSISSPSNSESDYNPQWNSPATDFDMPVFTPSDYLVPIVPTYESAPESDVLSPNSYNSPYSDYFSSSHKHDYSPNGICSPPLSSDFSHDSHSLSSYGTPSPTKTSSVPKYVENAFPVGIQNGTTPISVRKLKSPSITLTQRRRGSDHSTGSAPDQDCCRNESITARSVMSETYLLLDQNVKTNICLKVHQMPEKELLRLLLDALKELSVASNFSRRCNISLSIVYTICERFLMANIIMKYGPTLLQFVVFHCQHVPCLSQYIGECIARALETPESTGQKKADVEKFDFDEPDALGNTLIHKLVMKGDSSAPVLASLLRIRSNGNKVFNANRLNNEGYTPLHLASMNVPFRHDSESDSEPVSGNQVSYLQTIHVLIKHGIGDVFIKDGKSGNTALHIAVDSKCCDANVVMKIIDSLHADVQKSIVNTKNYSGFTPLDVARAARRSKNRPNYPKLVVEKLKKLR